MLAAGSAGSGIGASSAGAAAGGDRRPEAFWRRGGLIKGWKVEKEEKEVFCGRGVSDREFQCYCGGAFVV
jgi:hypothetical protein